LEILSCVETYQWFLLLVSPFFFFALLLATVLSRVEKLPGAQAGSPFWSSKNTPPTKATGRFLGCARSFFTTTILVGSFFTFPLKTIVFR